MPNCENKGSPPAPLKSFWILVLTALTFCCSLFLANTPAIYAEASRTTSDTITLNIPVTCTFTTNNGANPENQSYSADAAGGEIVFGNSEAKHDFNVVCNYQAGYTVRGYASDLKNGTHTIPFVTPKRYVTEGPSSNWTAIVEGGNSGATLGRSAASSRAIKTHRGISDVNGDDFSVTYQAYVGEEAVAGTYVGGASYYIILNPNTGSGEIEGEEDHISNTEAIGSVTRYGLTVSSEEDGVYSINGHSNNNVFVRLSHFLAISADRTQLMSDDMPNDTMILEKDRYYRLEVTPLSGSHDVDKNNAFRFVFRKTGEAEGYQFYGYDFYSGPFGSFRVPLHDDLGMFSLYIVAGYNFDNFRFRVSVHEVFPEEAENYGDISKTISGCGLTINFYDSAGVTEVNGTSDRICYIDLTNRAVYDKNPDTTAMTPLFQSGATVRLKYEYIKNVPTSTPEVSFTLRTVAESSASIPIPKVSSLSTNLGESIYKDNILSQDAAIFSMYTAKGAVFNNYQFIVGVEEI